MSKFLFFLWLFFATAKLQAQHKDPDDVFKKYPVSHFMDVENIKAIEIYNSETNRRWLINNNSLRKLKSILAKSFYTNNLFLKPGHLYIKIIGPKGLTNYYIYMYNESIYFDPYIYDRSLKRTNQLNPHSISLFNSVDWDKLK